MRIIMGLSHLAPRSSSDTLYRSCAYSLISPLPSPIGRLVFRIVSSYHNFTVFLLSIIVCIHALELPGMRVYEHAAAIKQSLSACIKQKKGSNA